MQRPFIILLQAWLSGVDFKKATSCLKVAPLVEKWEMQHWVRAGVSNPAPGELPSYRFQLQPQSNTPEPANQGLQGYLLISDRCVGAGLELKSAGW